MRRRAALVVANGAAGAEKQARALAFALTGAEPTVWRSEAAPWTRHLPLPLACSLLSRCCETGLYSRGLASLIEGMPPASYVVGSGRAVAPLVAAASHWRMNTVQVQLPRGAEGWFSAIVTPRHDFIARPPPPNAVLTRGSLALPLSPGTPARDPRCVAVLLGGSSRHTRFHTDSAVAAVLAASSAASAVLVTTSRRSPPEALAARGGSAALFDARQGRTRLFGALRTPGHALGAWPDNPVEAFLRAATVAVVSDDSATMIAEAAAAGTHVVAARCAAAASDHPLALAAAAAARWTGRGGKLEWSLARLEREGAVRWVRPPGPAAAREGLDGASRPWNLAEGVGQAVREAQQCGGAAAAGPLDDLWHVASRVRALCGDATPP